MSATCRDCGQGIAWGADARGARIPLELHVPVYRVIAFDPVTRTRSVERADVDGPVYYIAHSTICVKVKEAVGQARPERPDYRARRAGPDDQDVEPRLARRGAADAR